MSERRSRLAKNILASLTFQIFTILCGFILHRLILCHYGSKVNGLVNSIKQFLSIIGFLDLGVGAVVQSALYKPLAEHNNEEISRIVTSAQRFFNRIVLVLLIYVVLLISIYPLIANQDFGWFYTAALIAAMSINYFARYYFGIVDNLFLTACQRSYIQHNFQTISLIANTVACTLLISLSSSIHIVALTTSLIFLVRPLILRSYINKRYDINRRTVYKGEPIKQKWNGVAQHVSAVIINSTDSIVLTVLSTLSDVSIYSVYHFTIYGVKQLLILMTNGISPLLGEIWAKQELDELKDTFAWTEWSIHTGTTFIFGCTGGLVLPFIRLYTAGVNDANYLQPLFAVLITLAHASHCLRLPYNMMILACGHYKETQHCYIIAALVNIVVSVATVKLWGLIGVAIGTLVAMAYQTIWMAYYNSISMIKWPFKNFMKQICVDAVTVIIAVAASYWIPMMDNNYLWWMILAVEVAIVWGIVVVLINCLFYRCKMSRIALIVKQKLKDRNL